jgi:purine-binding chemotaxis protein CheW
VTHAVQISSASRFLTFRVEQQLYALRSEDVLEVIRVPALARVPQGPAALLGLANLRGAVLPVAGLRELLGKQAAPELPTARAIVLDVGAPVALVVDSVATLESVDAGQIETRQSEVSAEGREKLVGGFATGSDKQVAKILDIKALLDAAFANRTKANRTRASGSAAKPREHTIASGTRLAGETQQSVKTETLVTFEVAGQEFALPLAVVQEILPAPSGVTAVARAEAVVLGITSVRDTLLPLLSLRGLLGFAAAPVANDREKIVVMKVGNTQVGLVADRARAIVAAAVERMEPIPPALAARTGGESRIRSIYRGEAGRRLISILSPEQFFREDVMQRLAAHQKTQHAQPAESHTAAGKELIVLVFRLGGDEFGLPIDTVVEVAQVPEQITRIPKTPKFLEGVINLRGDVLPVVDQRRRFDMPKLDNTERRRLIVVKTDRHRAGLIVDSVSDVLHTPAESVDPPPELTDATSRLVRGVINLEKSQRIVLLLDPAELLTRAEQGLLDTFQAQHRKADA